MGFGRYSIFSDRNGGLGAGLTVVRRGRAKRKRFVYPPSDVALLWATQAQDSARNRTGNFYFEGDTIYSYGPHFPIARITDAKYKRRRVALFTSKGYRQTTSGHKSCVNWRGSSAGLFLIEVPEVRAVDEDTHLANYEYLVGEYEDLLKKVRRSPVNGPWLLHRSEDARRVANIYAKLFLPEQAQIPKPSDLALCLKRAKRRQSKFLLLQKKLAEHREFVRLARRAEVCA